MNGSKISGIFVRKLEIRMFYRKFIPSESKRNLFFKNASGNESPVGRQRNVSWPKIKKWCGCPKWPKIQKFSSSCPDNGLIVVSFRPSTFVQCISSGLVPPCPYTLAALKIGTLVQW